LKAKKLPSVIALTRQKVAPVRKKYSSNNECLKGAYELLKTGDDIKVILFACGSETGIACDVSHKLATENIYSKVISMPCQELFDKQDDTYKRQLYSGSELLVSIEASETNFWKKYTGLDGLNFGVNDFGKSAPYKDIYEHFNLNVENIVKKIKQKI